MVSYVTYPLLLGVSLYSDLIVKQQLKLIMVMNRESNITAVKMSREHTIKLMHFRLDKFKTISISKLY